MLVKKSKGIKIFPETFSHINYNKNIAVILFSLEYWAKTIEYIDKSLLSNNDFMREVIKIRPEHVKLLSKDQLDVLPVLEYCSGKPVLMKYVLENMENINVDDLIKYNYLEVNVITDKIKNDMDIAQKVKNCKPELLKNFEFAPQRIKDNREYLLMAVQKNGHMIMHSRKFLKDLEIVLNASKTFSQIYIHLCPEFKENDEIIRNCIKNQPKLITKVPRKLWTSDLINFTMDSVSYYDKTSVLKYILQNKK
jgi:hypothetical protein